MALPPHSGGRLDEVEEAALGGHVTVVHQPAEGGRTDLADGTLLCQFHHRRIHDNRFHTDRLPTGDIRYHRRP